MRFWFYYDESRTMDVFCKDIGKARKMLRRTQTELAKKSGTTQSVIARLESGNAGCTPSLDLLERVGKALNLKLIVGFEKRPKGALKNALTDDSRF